MGNTAHNQTARSVDRSADTMPWDMRERALTGWFGGGHYDLGKELAWFESADLTGYSVGRTDEGWRCVIRAVRKRAHVVAFVEAPTLPELLDMTAYMATNELLRWHPDRYADKRG